MPELGIVKSCKVMQIAKSTYYHQSIDWGAKDLPVLQEIEKFCEKLPESGYRSVTSHLRVSMSISKNRVQRVMQKNSLQCRRKRKYKRATTDSGHKLRKYPNLLAEKAKEGDYTKVIVGDITAFDIKGKNHYVATLLDLTNREPIGMAVSDRINTELAIAALNDARKNRKDKLRGYIHHTDSDSRYCSTDYIQMLQDCSMEISMCKGNAYENAFAESFNGVLKRQEIRVNEYDSLEHARGSILSFRKKYVELRPHSSLGGLTPRAFADRNFPELSTYSPCPQRKKKRTKKRKKLTATAQ